MKAKKILFITQEMTPYVCESELATAGREIPQAIQEYGHEIRTFMPKWGHINERRNQLHEVIRLSGMNLIIDETDHPLIIKVASIQAAHMQVYFIDNDDYFAKRMMAVDENGNEYDDNGERAIFYARGVLETVKKLRWAPDIILCQGWMSSIVPLYIKKSYCEEPSFRDSKVIYSLFGDKLTRPIGTNFRKCLEFRGISEDTLQGYSSEFSFDELNKLAIEYSDGLIISPIGENTELESYAEEKQIPILKAPEQVNAEIYSDFFEKVRNIGNEE